MKQALSKKYIFFTLLTFSTFVYFSLVPSIDFIPSLGAYDTQRVLQLTILAGTALLLLSSNDFLSHWLKTWFTLPNKVQYGLTSVLLLGILSSLTASDMRYAFLEVSLFALLFVFAIAVAAFYRQAPQLVSSIILTAVLLCVFFYTIKFITSYLSYYLVDGAVLWPAGDITLGFSHVRFFSHIQTWTIPFMVIPAILLPPKYAVLKWFITGLAAIWWMLVFGAAGRATIIASVFAMFVLLFLYRKESLPWLKLQIITCFAGFFLYTQLFRISTGGGSTDLIRSGDSGRLNFWNNAWSLMKQDPVLGAGPMQYAHVENLFLVAHPHNSYLQFAAEWGIPAFVTLFAIGLFGFYAWLRQNQVIVKKEAEIKPKLIRIGLTAALIAGSVDALVSGLIVFSMTQLYMALMFGWALGMYQVEKNDTQFDLPNHSKWFSGALLTLALLFMTWNASRDVVTLEEKLETYYSEHHTRWVAPRFWRQGKIGFD